MIGGIAIASAACTFKPGIVPDGDVDMMPDIPDVPPAVRVTSGLVGFWTFDDAANAAFLADTSGTASPVALEVVTGGSGLARPTISGGVLTASSPGRVMSPLSTHLPGDCQTAQSVTLEAWVKPSSASEGMATEPAFIVGLSNSVSSRDVALLQAATKYVGKVRTTVAIDGTPDLLSTSIASTTQMTHLVLVAGPTTRTLYVDDVAQATGTPGGPLGWDLTHPLMVLDEYQHARQWTGSIALIAIYARALSTAEVHQNFSAGAQ